MNARFPQSESAEAIEGTAAHWVGWELLKNETLPPGAKAPNGIVVTEEMIEGGELLADTIRSLVPSEIRNVHIEETLAAKMIHETECFGTPDYWAFDHNRKHIAIVDYKFGHRFVDEFWNPQGLCYLAAIIDYLCGIWGIQRSAFDLSISVSFTLVQPRCYYRGTPVRTHSFSVAEAVSHINRLRELATLALVPQPTATTNEHCRDCAGRHACSALQLAAYADAEYSNTRSPLELSPAAAALELRFLMRALERLESRVDGLKEITLATLRAGKQVPYFRAEPGYGRTVWKVPDSQVLSIGQLFGKDLSKPGTLTPTQAIKLGIDENIIKAYSFTPSTAMKLVRENPNDAPKVFGKQQE